MRITECLLETINQMELGSISLGAMVAASGKSHLWSDRSGAVPDVVIIHYTSAVNFFPAEPYELRYVLAIFCEYGVSSHFIIDRSGAIFRLVPIEKKAWHCGGSMMPEPDNRRGVNDFSVGIELLATADSGFTALQYHSLGWLCAAIETQCGITMKYLGHEDVAGRRAVTLGLRTDVKVDPGPLFEWQRFRDTLSMSRS